MALRNASSIHLARQRAEDALRQAKAELEEKTNDLDSFAIAHASHSGSYGRCNSRHRRSRGSNAFQRTVCTRCGNCLRK